MVGMNRGNRNLLIDAERGERERERKGRKREKKRRKGREREDKEKEEERKRPMLPVFLRAWCPVSQVPSARQHLDHQLRD